MNKLIITPFILISLVFLTSCSSSGEKAANEAIECMEKSIESNSNYEDVLREFDQCQQRIREQYANKASDPKFVEDFEKEFAIKYKILEEKMKKKFNYEE